jgi:hypothetical protein
VEPGLAAPGAMRITPTLFSIVMIVP